MSAWLSLRSVCLKGISVFHFHFASCSRNTYLALIYKVTAPSFKPPISQGTWWVSKVILIFVLAPLLVKLSVDLSALAFFQIWFETRGWQLGLQDHWIWPVEPGGFISKFASAGGEQGGLRHHGALLVPALGLGSEELHWGWEAGSSGYTGASFPHVLPQCQNAAKASSLHGTPAGLKRPMAWRGCWPLF